MTNGTKADEWVDEFFGLEKRAERKLNPLSQANYAVVLHLMDAATALARGHRTKALGSIMSAERRLRADLGSESRT